jgi:hypothetical protein
MEKAAITATATRSRDQVSVRPLLGLTLCLICALTRVGAGASLAVEPVWGKMGGIAVGMLQEAVIYNQGLGHRESCTDKGCADVRDYDGVQVIFEHGRVGSVNCAAPGPLAGHGCPNGFVLPDGVALGTRVPFGKSWRGYIRYIPPDAQYDFFYWKKHVRIDGRLIGVYLMIEKGKVIGIGEGR